MNTRQERIAQLQQEIEQIREDQAQREQERTEDIYKYHDYVMSFMPAKQSAPEPPEPLPDIQEDVVSNREISPFLQEVIIETLVAEHDFQDAERDRALAPVLQKIATLEARLDTLIALLSPKTPPDLTILHPRKGEAA